jgi:hypothetical protein
VLYNWNRFLPSLFPCVFLELVLVPLYQDSFSDLLDICCDHHSEIHEQHHYNEEDKQPSIEISLLCVRVRPAPGEHGNNDSQSRSFVNNRKPVLLGLLEWPDCNVVNQHQHTDKIHQEDLNCPMVFEQKRDRNEPRAAQHKEQVMC